LEKIEGKIKIGQSRDTGNIRHTRHVTKTYKTPKHNTTKKAKGMNNEDPPPPKKNRGCFLGYFCAVVIEI
jgi:hypothetical protein